MKRIEKLYYKILIYVVRERMKYNLFVIDSDENLQVLFHYHRQFSYVRIPELLAKVVDVVSSLGGSNRNHQSIPIPAASSSTSAIASSSLLVIAFVKFLVASPSFAGNLHCDETAELGANINAHVMISISGAVGEPNVVEVVLGDEDDVESATIDDDSDDNIGRSIPVGTGGASSLGTQQYSLHFSALDLDAMRLEGLPDIESRFGARDSHDTASLDEF
ncbi:hypothetical protein Ahy_A01g004585 [Arachis hypogaea]|uniref:Uncharacterized protein n=1 Tax=Arachis hypogaea TaxID=3818 RepID=A0A445EWJ0_ARAHY|nr:hypothetical protein Ahy_A01g004585 [Arachis hypogaea]